MNMGYRLLRSWFLVTMALWLAGCSRSPAARFYTLNSLGQQQAQSSAPAGGNVSVRITTVEIPDYLERPEIVTRNGQNELKQADFDRWGGSLSGNIGAVLAEDLALLLGTDRVYLLPRVQGEKAHYTLALRVLRLDLVPGDQVLLKAQWTLSESDSMEAVTRLMSFSQRLPDKSYDSIAAGVSSALERLSREIAREITQRPKEPAAVPPVQGTP